MPSPKRWFPCSRDIADDPEVWELTNTFGDRSLRLWIEILSILDKDENRLKLSGRWLPQLASRTRLNLKTVVQAIVWMLDRQWIVVHGDARLSEEWLQTCRKLAADWPQTRHRLATDSAETQRKLTEEWAETGRKLSLASPNYSKYHRTRGLKGSSGAAQPGDELDPLRTVPNRTGPKIEESVAPDGAKSASLNVIQFEKPKQKGVKLADAEFIAELKGNVAYRHIDIDRELGKMDAWLSLPKNSSRKKTRQFVVNWLNRIEPPMAPSAQPAGVRRIPL